MSERDQPESFHDVLDAERAEVARRRIIQYGVDGPGPPDSPVGLALSGGGIRSATFCLGLLQGLDRLALLRIFDYLSTVSGGGFTGAWWTTWLTRDLFDVRHLAETGPPGSTTTTLVDCLVKDGLAPPDGALSRACRGVEQNAEPERRGTLEADLKEAVVRELNALAERTDLWSLPALAGLSSEEQRRAWRDKQARGGFTRMETRRLNIGLLTRRYAPHIRQPVPPLIFPQGEELESRRSPGYLNADLPDGALAAGTDPVHHLRVFSNYLTPRKGWLSADTWRAVALVTRNLLLTWLVLLPVLLATILAGQLYFLAQPFDLGVGNDFTVSEPGRADRTVIEARARVAARPLLALGALFAVLTVLWMRSNNAGWALTHNASLVAIMLMVAGAVVIYRQQASGEACSGWLDCLRNNPQAVPLSRPDKVLIAMTGVAAVALCLQVMWLPSRGLFAAKTGRQKQVQSNRATRWQGIVLTTGVVAGLVLAFAGFAHELMPTLFEGVNFRSVGATLVSLATAAGTIFTAFHAAPTGGAEARSTRAPSRLSRAALTLTPPLVLLILAMGGSWLVHVVLSKVLTDFDATLPLLSFETFVGVGLCLVFAAYEAAAGIRGAERTLPAACALLAVLAAWFMARAFTFGAAAPYFTAGIANDDFGKAFLCVILACALVMAAGWQRVNPRALSLGALAAGVLGALYSSARKASDLTLSDAWRDYWTGLYGVTALLGFALFWVVALGWMGDPNALSLHAFYRARLVRAYLGASNWRRHLRRSRISDAVEGDDVGLSTLDSCAHGGPYHLVNTTLNLAGSRDLTVVQRQAAAFLLSKLYCGSVRTGYRTTRDYMAGELSLGAAVAASGAAVSPNMGAKTPKAPLAMLLTLLNVRLGFWVPTPHKDYWRLPQARLWPYYLLRESLSQTTELSSYCYLTDGGHFDNTGLYSLVERGCRYIVLVDNGADPKPAFEDVGEAIRRCRIDFATEITLDVSGFERTEGFRVETSTEGPPAASIRRDDSRGAQQHYTVGTVRYSEAHGRELGWAADADLEGIVVWLRPALVADEEADVRQYGLQNAAFPEQPTVDQWFDEAQFESYRRLGEFTATTAFGQPVATLRAHGHLVEGEPLRAEDVRELFRAIRGR